VTSAVAVSLEPSLAADAKSPFARYERACTSPNRRSPAPATITSAGAHNHFLVVAFLPNLTSSIAASQPHVELVESFDSLTALASGSRRSFPPPVISLPSSTSAATGSRFCIGAATVWPFGPSDSNAGRFASRPPRLLASR